MNENLTRKPRGLSGQGLRTWGLLLLAAGIFGHAVLQNRLLGVQSISGHELLEKMQSSETVMLYATLAIVLQVLEACAAPIFVFLLLEGFQRTSSYKNYLLRVAGVALLSELPYNLAYSGKWIDMGSRNPAFALVLCLIILYFYRMYEGKEIKKMLIKVFVTLAAFLWGSMLRIASGGPCILLLVSMWALRNLKNYRILLGSVAGFLCTVFSPYYIGSPLVYMALHSYNEEKGEGSRVVNYLSYPVLLLAFGLAGMYLI